MKWRRFIFPMVALIIMLFVMWGVSASKADPSKQTGQFEMPELPPPVPHDIGTPKPWPTTPPLARELTESEALEIVSHIDSKGVQWEKSWSLDNLEEERDRITVELYGSRSEADKSIGLEIGYSPDLEIDAGKVWVVTIRGTANASMMMMHMPEDELVDGVTYFISARTGELLGMNTWPKMEK